MLGRLTTEISIKFTIKVNTWDERAMASNVDL